MEKKLTIIILTFNSQEIIKACLSRINFDQYKVVVVDNNSQDDTVKIVKENFQVDKLYELPSNIGFGNANNVALEEVDTNYALVLNPDAMIEEDDIEKVLKVLESDDKFVIAGPVILENHPYEDEEYHNRLQYIEDNHGVYQETPSLFYVNFLVGCTLFFKMSVMREVGFFDKNIFLFYEENELCHRVMKAGYHPVLVKDAKALHIQESSSTKTPEIEYLRNWHKIWSKIYHKNFAKGKFKASFFAVRNIIFSLYPLAIAFVRSNQSKIAIYSSTISASCSFLIGLKPFKKDGTPRIN